MKYPHLLVVSWTYLSRILSLMDTVIVENIQGLIRGFGRLKVHESITTASLSVLVNYSLGRLDGSKLRTENVKVLWSGFWRKTTDVYVRLKL